MVRDPLQMDAARRQLMALDAYERRFETMAAAEMTSELHHQMNDSLEQVRQAALLNPRNLLFNTTQLVLAHSNLTSRMWQSHLGQQPDGGEPISELELQSLRQSHQRAVERLRDRCCSLLANNPESGAPL